MKLPKRYNPQQVELEKYQLWLQAQYFEIKNDDRPTFSMVIPPPNVTGKLHLGHAWNGTIQDILARYKRSRGYDVLWLPGMDHAGIATQAVVEALLTKQGEDRYKLGREKFLHKMWEWKNQYAESIRRQWAKLGLSLSYDFERFTLDEGMNKAVTKVFVDLYNKGLIYRGERIINWDPEQKTAISNIEVIHKEIIGQLYYFNYLVSETGESLIVATTRPETMFADVAVFVHPDDKRYKNLLGKMVINPSNGEKIPIMEDEYVDIEFGTGAMKCTPAHDPNDFELGKKYGLPMPICINKDATMNELAKQYQNLDRYECRQAMVKDLKGKGLLIKVEDIKHAVGFSERSDVVVEPYLSKQWFVAITPLAQEALKAQDKNKGTSFFPERFEKIYGSWLKKLEDWCISRQLWWGHRIPAYYHKYTNKILVSEEKPEDIENYTQDEDVLDTWFSSALWPFSTMGWPKITPLYKRFYPVDVLVTAYDIIFFWVARMMIAGLEFTNQAPFKDVYIHGLIRDEQGRKMSKSLGNGVDPMDVIANHGADALRYFLATNSSPGLDMRYSEEKIVASGQYLNKIWNAARYILMALGNDFKVKSLDVNQLNDIDKYILTRLNSTMESVANNLDKYELGIASTILYDFVYDEFCSWYIELSKISLNSKEQANSTKQVLYQVLKAVITMIYPFAPFISEEIYLQMPDHKPSIMEESYPTTNHQYNNERSVDEIEFIKNIIKDVRQYKIEEKLPPNATLKLYLKGNNGTTIEKYIDYIQRFTFSNINVVDKIIEAGNLTYYVYALGEMAIEQEENIEDVINKIDHDIEFAKSEINRAKRMLDNPSFLTKASSEKIEQEQKKLAIHTDNLNKLTTKRDNLLKNRQ
jgi:valyl-tRNA synthetase